VVGFFYGLIHACLSLYFYLFDGSAPQPNYQFGKVWPILGSFTIPNTVAFIFGVTALVLFAFMALISLKYFILKLGGILWRKLLRYCGYAALSFVLLHFFIKSFNVWVHPGDWQNLPPLTLWMWLAGVVILILRLMLWRKLALKKAALAKA
jgi:hypothetical protein